VLEDEVDEKYYLSKKMINYVLKTQEDNGFIINIKQSHHTASTIKTGQGRLQKGADVIIQVGNVDKRGHNSKWGRVYSPEGQSVSVTAEGGGLRAKSGLYKTQSRIRRLTPVECERLQGFPDGWTEGVSDTQRYKMMGNAVSIPVITAIGKRILKSIK
jgi:site-specific DNA-cytosine methylase